MAKDTQASQLGKLPVSELLGEYQGANSPFGDDVQFPLPINTLRYEHPELVEPREEEVAS